MRSLFRLLFHSNGIDYIFQSEKNISTKMKNNPIPIEVKIIEPINGIIYPLIYQIRNM